MGDIDQKNSAQATKIVGDDESLCADVVDESGKKRLAVTEVGTPGAPGSVPCYSSKTRYDDMNSSTGGVDRDTSIDSTFTTVYKYPTSGTGSGLLFGFGITMESNDNVYYRLLIDGEDVLMGSTGILSDDLAEGNKYNLKKDALEDHVGLSLRDKTFRWKSPLNLPTCFTQSVEVRVKRTGGSKKFKAGYAVLSKET